MNSIPILRFPILVIREILSTMSPFELIHLSMTSAKTKRIVTISSKTKYQNKLKLEASINDDYGVSIRTNRCRWDYRFVRWRVREGRSEFQIRKYTENQLEEFKKLCDCIQDIFGLEFQYFFFFLEFDHNQNILIVDYLKTKQENYKKIELRSRSLNDKDVKYLLDNLKFSDFLSICCPIKTENFKMDLPVNVDYLRILFAEFVKLEQLLKLNCGRIRLLNTSLTNKDINLFLKSWMASKSNLNLVYLQIVIESRSTRGILKDILHEDGDEKHFQNKYIDQIVRGGLDIKRIDGKPARIYFRLEPYRHIMEFIIH